MRNNETIYRIEELILSIDAFEESGLLLETVIFTQLEDREIMRDGTYIQKL